MKKIANLLTLLRAIAGLPLAISLAKGYIEVACSIFILGNLTDLLDGWLARKSGGGSDWGARLDPLADKIFILAPMIWLTSQSVLPPWVVWIIVSRELVISEWRSKASNGGKASIMGKLKTSLQFTSILLMIWPLKWGGENIMQNLHLLGWFLFWPSVLLAILSAYDYLKGQSIFDQLKDQDY